MPRDYKHRANRRKKRRKLSPLTGIVAGLLIGLFVAFLVYLKTQVPDEPPAYFQESVLPPVEETRPDSGAPAESQPAQTAQPSGPPPLPQPRFDFYTLLPEMEVVVPEEEAAPAAPPPPVRPPEPAAKAEPKPKPAAAPAPAAPPVREAAPAAPAGAATQTAGKESWLLQVGSFRNGEQAERLRAELALLGLQTSIQKVTIANNTTYHRVRVGPFRDSSSLESARSRLAQRGLQGQVIKIR